MIDSEIKSQSFQLAVLRSERARIIALLSAFGSLLGLILIRVIFLAEGQRSEAWPFAVSLAVMSAYEMVLLRLVGRAIVSGRRVSAATWAADIFIESLLPTTTLFLQIHTSFVGPHRALTSPAVLVYFLFIILSTLHLQPRLSHLAGAFSATGYFAVSVYTFLLFPQVAAADELLVYGTFFSFAGLLLLAARV